MFFRTCTRSIAATFLVCTDYTVPLGVLPAAFRASRRNFLKSARFSILPLFSAKWVHRFKVLSLNVNGMNDSRKRRLVFSYFRNFWRSVIFLQETHSSRGSSALWTLQWCNTVILSENSSNSQGVAILFSRDLKPVILHSAISNSSRIISCRFQLDSLIYKLINVYMPTSNLEADQIAITGLIGEIENDCLILGGDYNVALHSVHDRDGYAYRDSSYKRYRQMLLDLLDE